MTLLLSASLLLGFNSMAFLRKASAAFASPVQQTDQASAALKEGRRLLKRGKADQALGQLQTALTLYTTAKNNHGVAAAEKELGDLYLRQGQDKTALDHYQKAYQALTGVLSKEKTEAAATGSAARLVDSKAGTAANTAASLKDTGFNAQLLLAKIGDTHYRLGQMSDASASYARMSPKKPEGA